MAIIQEKNDQIAHLGRSIQEIENEKVEQQQLLRTTHQRNEAKGARIETRLSTQVREKQQCENGIRRLTRDIEQRRRTLEEKQESMSVTQAQIDTKQWELSTRQQQRSERQQQSARKQESERLVQQNENDLRATNRDLKRLNRSVIDEQRASDQINKSYQTSTSQANGCRAVQLENDRQFS